MWVGGRGGRPVGGSTITNGDDDDDDPHDHDTPLHERASDGVGVLLDARFFVLSFRCIYFLFSFVPFLYPLVQRLVHHGKFDPRSLDPCCAAWALWMKGEGMGGEVGLALYFPLSLSFSLF